MNLDVAMNDLKDDTTTSDKLLPVDPNLSKQNAIPFSEALELTGFGKFNYFLIFISGMVLANVLIETSGMAFILPIAQCDLQLTNHDKGVLSAIGFAGIISSSHLWGFLADTKGRRRVICPTLIAGFIVTFFSSFSKTFWIMVVMRFLNGFFISGGSAVIYAYLGEFHSDQKRSRSVMGASFVFALGALAVPFIAFIVLNQQWTVSIPILGIDYKPWRLFLVVCGSIGFLCGVSLLPFPESPKFLLSQGKEHEAIEVLQQMYSWNGGNGKLKVERVLPEADTICAPRSIANAESHFMKKFLNTMWDQTAPLFQGKYLRTTIIICTIQFWLYVTNNGMYMWFPYIISSMVEYMTEHPGNNASICEIVYAKEDALHNANGTIQCVARLENTTYIYSFTLEITYALSFALLGLIINRVNKMYILCTISVGFAVCGFLAVSLNVPSISTNLYVAFFLCGVAINVLGGMTLELYPTNVRAMAICISLMAGRLGSVIGANMVGLLLEKYCEITFYIACTALVVCGLLGLLLPKPKDFLRENQIGS